MKKLAIVLCAVMLPTIFAYGLGDWPFSAPTVASTTSLSPQPGDIVFNDTDDEFLGYNGSGWVVMEKPATSAGVEIVILQHEESSGSSEGDASGADGTWRKRELTKCYGKGVTDDTDCTGVNWITLDDTNWTFELQEGTYLIEASAPAYDVNAHQLALHDGTNRLPGQPNYTLNSSGSNNFSYVKRIVEVAESTSVTYYLDHYMSETNPTQGNGLGQAAASSIAQVFSQVTITRYDEVN